MKPFYALTLLSVFFLSSGCSKDVLKSYDKRIQGTWIISDIDRYGFNGADNLPFDVADRFTFSQDGSLQYEQSGEIYNGSWDIVRQTANDDGSKKSLHVTAINFTDQQVRSEYFNDMVFTSTNRFTGFINYNTRTYVYRFVRQ